MSHNFFKIGAAAALTVTGFSAATSVKTVSASSFKTAIKRVRIKYLPGQGVRIWTNYNNGQFMGFRAKDGTEWNIAQTAIDKSGNLWYKVGTREWIEARYTEDIENPKPAKTKKPKKTKNPVVQILDKTAKNVAAKKKKTAEKKADDQAPAQKPEVKKNDKVAAPTKPTALKNTVKKTNKIKKAKSIVTNTLNKLNKASTPAQKPASQQAPSVSTATKLNAIVSLAKQQVGKPYIWGGVGPDNYDCSGLVQYVYGHAAGVNMPRVTADQVRVGQTVPMDQLKPGDLIYWGSTTSPYHVAIYVGNDQYVSAATPDQGVALQKLTTYYYPTIAKRVL